MHEHRAHSARRLWRAPRHARARWYDWARRRSYCMELMRVVTEQRLRVQTGACAHELFMPYVRVTVIMACARRSCTMWAASHPRRLPGRGQRRWHALCTWCARAAVSGRVRRARAPRARAPLCAPVVRSFVEVDFGVYGEPVWLEIDDAAVPIAHGGCSGHVRDACGSLGAILRQKQVGKKCFGFRPASAATRRRALRSTAHVTRQTRRGPRETDESRQSSACARVVG